MTDREKDLTPDIYINISEVRKVQNASCKKDKKIRLVKVDRKNFDALIDLEVDESQKNYVADNIYSLAEAYATLADGKFVVPFGIYAGEAPVGFLMIGYDIDDCRDGVIPYFTVNSYLIWRFMIAKEHQKKGYGKEAMKLALDYIRTLPAGPAEYCWLSYEPENEAAKKLYASFGFTEVPEFYEEGDEMPAVIRL